MPQKFWVAEILAKLIERGVSELDARNFVKPMEAICHPLSSGQAKQAAAWCLATRKPGLSLGDRCCLALGLELGAEVYTADRAWAGLDLGVKVRVVR